MTNTQYLMIAKCVSQLAYIQSARLYGGAQPINAARRIARHLITLNSSHAIIIRALLCLTMWAHRPLCAVAHWRHTILLPRIAEALGELSLIDSSYEYYYIIASVQTMLQIEQCIM